MVTNINMMSTEYFHPKTTPETPVRLAVRMSMGIPGKVMQYGGWGPELTLLTPFNIDNKVLVPFGFHSVDFYLQTLTVTLYVFFLKNQR